MITNLAAFKKGAVAFAHSVISPLTIHNMQMRMPLVALAEPQFQCKCTDHCDPSAAFCCRDRSVSINGLIVPLLALD